MPVIGKVKDAPSNNQGYIQYAVSIAISSLVMHNGQTADPLNAYAKSLKEISSRKKKTDADHEAMARIEFEAGLYINKQTGNVCLPSAVLEASIAVGARKSKEGKQALSGLFVDTDADIILDGKPISKAEVIKRMDEFRLTTGVRVGQARVIRTRPQFQNVVAEFVISVRNDIANAEQARRWLSDMLSTIGIGDWRPRHGRGELLSFETMKLKKAA